MTLRRSQTCVGVFDIWFRITSQHFCHSFQKTKVFTLYERIITFWKKGENAKDFAIRETSLTVRFQNNPTLLYFVCKIEWLILKSFSHIHDQLRSFAPTILSVFLKQAQILFSKYDSSYIFPKNAAFGDNMHGAIVCSVARNIWY